jgi:hypothetical protein
MMATKKRKHVNKVLNEEIFNELINDSGPTGEQKITDDSIFTLNRQSDKGEVKQPDNGTTAPNFDAGQAQSTIIDEAITLNAIVDHYHKRLYENDLATGYLKAKGITNPETWGMFKIGFCDGSLLNLLSKKQIEECKKFGIIGEDGEESLKNSFTFPVFDETGNVICLYDLNIDADKKTSPVYFTDDKVIIFNFKATKVYDQIILTKNILEALSLMTLGFQNVVCISEVVKLVHIQKLKENRVKKIVIAYGADYSEQSKANILKDILIEEGFAVKMIYPKGNDTWNQALLSGMDKEFIKLLIGAEKEYKKAEEKKISVKKDGTKYRFAIDRIVYEVIGIKEMFVNDLKVKIKAECDGEIFPDSIDLYASRSRNSYALNLSQKFNVEPKKVEKDLLTIFEYFETERDKKIMTGEKEVFELTEQERNLGLSFLKSPDLFNQIIDDMTSLGYVGEDINKQLLYLCATSRLMDDPISVLIISQSASGKSYLVETVAKLIPENEVIDFNTVSKQALQYMGDRLLNKFMIMGEATHDPDIEHQIREILSGHKLSRYVVVKNEKTGEMTTEKFLVKANVSSALTTTNNKVNPENASRYFIANADESRVQTQRIYEAQKHKYSEERQLTKKNVIPNIIKKHHAAQRLLRKIMIVFPSVLREKLRFPDLVMRLRRDHERFIDLIAVVCFLRQMQKEIKSNNEFEYIECDRHDYRIAYNILMNGVLPSTVSEMPKGAIEVHEELKKMSKEFAVERKVKPEEVILTQREIREYTGFSHTWIKINLRILVDYEYVEVVKGGRSRSKGHYRIKKDEEIKGINFKMIPTPEDMDKILK